MLVGSISLSSAESTLLVLTKILYLTGHFLKKKKKKVKLEQPDGDESSLPLQKAQWRWQIWPSENKGPKSEPEMVK